MDWDASQMVEIRLKSPDDFLKCRETLTRIGVASRSEKKLYQSCHILHKQGKYYIVHFKELFMLDGKQTNFDVEDQGRRNTIVNLLQQWELIKVVDKAKIETPSAPLSQIKILPYKDKDAWELVAKYSIGRKK